MVDMDLLYRVAHDYYINKKLQREIANELNVSRVQVSKYLSKAEKVGIVRIEVVRPQVDSTSLQDLKARMMERFELKDVLISPSYGNLKSVQDTLHNIAREYIFSVFNDTPMNVGLGWGSTIYNFATSQMNEARTAWRILPLTGGSTLISSKYFNINHIAQNFAEKVGASVQLVYLPLMVDSSNGEMMRESDEYKRISSMWSNLDLIICSVGYSIPRSPLFQQGLIGEEYIEKLQSRNVVGDILTHYFDEDGVMINLGVEKSMINITVEQIASAKTKLIIAYGKDKIKSILGGMRSGLIDVLVTDANTAESVLRLSESKGG